jgi:phosphatidate phosphatase PAH1
VGIKEAKIFIINPSGEIKQYQNEMYSKSYPSIQVLVDMMFPNLLHFHTPDLNDEEAKLEVPVELLPNESPIAIKTNESNYASSLTE